MNIFYLDPDPIVAAQQQCNAHVIKMTLETTQILCSVLWQYGHEAPYRPTHIMHPCVVWAGQSAAHFEWLHRHGYAQAMEYHYRYKRYHKCHFVLLGLRQPIMPYYRFVPPPQAMPDYCRHPDTVEAYRRCYINEKQHILEWTRRDPPYWIRSYLNGSTHERTGLADAIAGH